MTRTTTSRLTAALGLATVLILSTVAVACAGPPDPGDPPAGLAIRFAPMPTATTAPATTTPATPRTQQPAPSSTGQPEAPGADQSVTPESGTNAAAPSAGLRKLADAMTTSQRSISLNVNFAAGATTVPTEVSVLYGGLRKTEQYQPDRGTHLDLWFAAGDGAQRSETVTVTLTELTPEHRHYSVLKQVTVTPLYTVTTSPVVLEADINGSCDLFGSADPTLVWMDPAGVQHREDTDYGIIEGFRGSWGNVGATTDHRMPTLSWIDRDPAESGDDALTRRSDALFAPLPVEMGQHDWAVGIGPSYTRSVTEELAESGGDGCSARITYRITYTLQRL